MEPLSARDVALVRLGRAGLFRRSHSKPEHPTSDMAATAIAAETGGQMRKSCQQLVLLRNFSVLEQDIVICNRVRCGADPATFRARNSGDPNYLRSLSMEEARVAALQRRRRTDSVLGADEPMDEEEDDDEPMGEAVEGAPVAPVKVVTPATPEGRAATPVKRSVTFKTEAAPPNPPPFSLSDSPRAVQVTGGSNNSSNSTSSSTRSLVSDSGRVAPLAESDDDDDDIAALRSTLSHHLSMPNVLKKTNPRTRAASESSLLHDKKRKIDPFNRYLIRDQFANGAYGKVCSGEDNSSHQEVAVKIVPKAILMSAEEKQAVVREQKIHQTLNHPHIIKLIDVFEDEGAHYFVLERADSGALASIIGCTGLEEVRCRNIFHQLLLALEYLHFNHIVHHDIKPHNVLLHTNGIKLCDFGASRSFDPHETKLQFAGIFGTPGYIGKLGVGVWMQSGGDQRTHSCCLLRPPSTRASQRRQRIHSCSRHV